MATVTDTTPVAAIELRRVATPLEFAQAALVLGEQRAWAEAWLGGSLAELQPSSRSEYSCLAEFYARPHGQLVLARLGGEPVGVIAVRRLADGRGEGKRLYVRPVARGHGIGRRLVAELLRLARELGVPALYVETSPERMAAAYELCVELGFRETRKLGLRELDFMVALELTL
jgi:GNAT superfamily N-acetyltransferase